jgi:hypothetical protein
VDEHVQKRRLHELADNQSHLTEFEVDHMEKCSECQAAFAKSILQVARIRAKNKVNNTSHSSV